MKKTCIVVSMHNGLSTSFIKAAQRFADTTEVVDLPLDESDVLESYYQKIECILKNNNSVLVLTDFLSSACTISFMRVLKKYSFALVSGMNMAMLLEAIQNSELMDCFELAECIQTASKADIKICNKLLEEVYEEK